MRLQEKGWMDEEGRKLWIKDIKTRGERTLLVWDSFRGHLTDGAKSYAKKRKIDQAVIPGGLTGILQPLDVVINKPFKDQLRQLWQDWMINGKHQFTASGKQKKPTKNQVLQWIKTAWETIPESMVRKSFLKTGITNALDGTQDDEIAEEDEDGSHPGRIL